ncbi:MAG: nucleotidyltransferase [Bacteroidota bacterium]
MQYKEQLEKLSISLQANNVDYIVIGGFAVNYHGYARATSDLDVWLKPSNENYIRFVKAIESMGYDVEELHNAVFNPKKTFIRIPFGIINIEFLTDIPGNISFSDAVDSAEIFELGNVTLKVMSYEHLIQNKKATNRPKDLQDIIELQRRKDGV